MNMYFANTSTLWAYRQIHQSIGNSAADIWRYTVQRTKKKLLWMVFMLYDVDVLRYAVLYIHGGGYMDDDSYIESALDNIVESKNKLIFAKESNEYKDACYLSDYRLSREQMISKYSSLSLRNGHTVSPQDAEKVVDSLFDGKILVSWALFVQPKHELMLRVLGNIVELIRYEYLLKSVVNMMKYDVKWKICMCTTGPSMLTASARDYYIEFMAQHGTSQLPSASEIRVINKDFVEFGGNYKMVRGHESNPYHYMHIMQVSLNR
jgi:hypothetical protein